MDPQGRFHRRNLGCHRRTVVIPALCIATLDQGTEGRDGPLPVDAALESPRCARDARLHVRRVVSGRLESGRGVTSTDSGAMSQSSARSAVKLLRRQFAHVRAKTFHAVCLGGRRAMQQPGGGRDFALIEAAPDEVARMDRARQRYVGQTHLFSQMLAGEQRLVRLFVRRTKIERGDGVPVSDRERRAAGWRASSPFRRRRMDRRPPQTRAPCSGAS